MCAIDPFVFSRNRVLPCYLARMFPQSGSDPEEMMRQMSIPDLVQKLQMAESTFGQVHPQVCTPTASIALIADIAEQ